MQCPQCRFDNPEDMSFCVECGTRLSVRCDQCGAEMQPRYKFCGQCGNRLRSGGGRGASSGGPSTGPSMGPASASDTAPGGAMAAVARPATPPSGGRPAEAEGRSERSKAEPSASEGERKQVTVFFCDLVASSDDGRPISPDLLHGVLNRFYELAQDAVRKYGGVIHQFVGEQLMAIFGAPVAYEDHPRRAVLAGLDLRTAVEENQRHLAGDGKVHWQVRLGLDTGPLVVGGIGGTVVGEATVKARQIQTLAEPGELLVSEAVGRLVLDHVELRELGAGRPESPRALAVVKRDSSAALATLLGSRAIGPFVGRQHELVVLEELRTQANSGLGQVVGLAGDAGTGKSRLLHEFYQRTFPGQPVSYLRGQCLSYGSGVPFLPIIDMIRKASRIADGDDGATVATKLRASLEQVSGDVEGTLPYLLRLLGVEQGTEVLSELEPHAIQARIFDCMRRLIFDACRRALVVVEIEDLHWIDETSAEFFESLIEMMATSRLLVLLTYRAGYQPRWLEKSYATQITLRRLSAAESTELFDSLSGDAEIAADLREALIAKADGNPFFLEELVRSIQTGDAAASVPDTIQGILMARIDRMPDAHKRLMRTASVLGRRFSLDLLRELWDGAESPDDLLEDLQRWELVYRSLEEEIPTWVFKHALTQEVTYQSLLSERRKELHARAAHTLEALYEGRIEDALDRLIYHYPAAGEPEKTVHYLTLFAERAAGDYAHAEAVKALLQALEHAQSLDEEVRDRRVVELLLEAAESMLPLARFGETLDLFEQYRSTVEALEDPTLAAPYHFWLGHTHTYLGQQELASEHSKKAIELARESGDQATEGKASYVLGRDGFWSGHFDEGVESSQRAVVLLERAGEPWWQGQSYWVAGFNLYALGRFQEAIDALERAFAIGEALDDYRLDPSWSLGYFYASLGEAELGIEQCQRALERSKDPLNSAVSEGFLGFALLQKGENLAAAIDHLEAGAESMRRAGMQQILGWFLAFLGEARRMEGELGAAKKAAEEGLTAALEADFAYGAGLARQCLGRTALAEGDSAAARGYLDEALDSFQSMGVPFEIARTRLDLSKVAGAEGRADEAEALAREALEGFEAQKVPFWIEKARQQSESLGR